MGYSTQIGRADGGTEIGVVPAAQTTLVAGTTEVPGAINQIVPVAGSTAVRLPFGAGGPIVIKNLAATAVTLLVFPPWNPMTNAAAGGKINGGSGNASISVAQNASAVLFPHANGIDFTAVVGS